MDQFPNVVLNTIVVPPMPTFEENDDEGEVNSCVRFGFRLACQSAFHPLEYAKVLIQLGYEPIAPVPGKTLFGEKVMLLPSLFRYAWHIRQVDGFYGCFNGLRSKLVGNVLSSHYSEKIADWLGFVEFKEDKRKDPWQSKDDDEQFDRQLDKEFVQQLNRNVVVHVASAIISHPFHVVSVRMMAQFIGREKIYTGVLQSFRELWKQEGFFGFFAGFVPRLICDLGCLVLSSSITYLVTKYAIRSKEFRVHTSTLTSLVVSNKLYPWHVVSTCMIVNGSRLQAGRLPMMEPYINWKDCYGKLRAAGEHKRGSSIFFRTKPQNKSDIYPAYPRYT